MSLFPVDDCADRAFLSRKTLCVRLLSSTIVSPQTAFISSSFGSSRCVLRAMYRSRSKGSRRDRNGLAGEREDTIRGVYLKLFEPVQSIDFKTHTPP
jgi:hypothetical protein